MEYIWNRTLTRAVLLAKLSNWWRRALVSVVTKNLMITLVELHDHMWRINLQEDKHHCNTPPIWALWWCGQVKTHENTPRINKKAPKGTSDSEKRDSLVWWNLILSIMFEGNQLCSSPAEYHYKVKCSGSSSCCGDVFQQQGLKEE